MRFLRNTGLTGRAITICTLLVLGTAGCISIALTWRCYVAGLAHLTARATNYARALSYSVEPAVLLNDRAALQNLVDAAEADDVAEAAEVLDHTGMVLSTFHRRERLAAEHDHDAALLVKAASLEKRLCVERTGSHLHVVVPIWPTNERVDLDLGEEREVQAASDAPIGFVSLRYGLDGVYADALADVLFAVLVAVAVVVVGIGVTIIAVRQLVRPVRNLVETTTQIADGDLSRRASEQAVAEIGLLATSFNHMAARLQETYTSIERKVAERTAALEAQHRELQAEITERKRAEQELLAEKYFSDTTIDSTPGIFYLFDDRGTFVRWNTNFERTSRYSSQEIAKMTPVDFIADEDKERVAAAIEEVFTEGESSVEAGFAPKNGTAIPHFFTGKRITLNGSVYVVGTGIDITERQAATEALRTSEMRLRRQNVTLMELANSKSLYGGDLTAALAEITEAAARTLDVPRSSVWLFDKDRVRLTCHDLYESDAVRHSDGLELNVTDFPSYFAALEMGRAIAANDAHRDPRTAEFSQPYLTPLGITSSLDAPIRRGRDVVGVVCSEHTGPPRTWSAEEENFAGSLADLVSLALESSDRRRAQQALKVAKDFAEAASRAKSDFLANMSHEIRTPMTAILGFVDLLAEDCPRDCAVRQGQYQDHLKTVTRNGQHLLSVIDDILDLTRIEGGRLRAEQIPCAVGSLVTEVMSLMRPQAEAKGLSLDAKACTRIPEKIHTDPTRLRQILINVIGNAIKFTSVGVVRVEVSLDSDISASEAGRSLMRFDVIDTGIGMSKEQIERIFRPFTQGDESMSRQFGGTGLGLSISKRLAALLGGDITVESQAGRGSTFRITIATGVLDGVELIELPEATSAFTPPREAKLATSATSHDAAFGGADQQLKYSVLLAEDAIDNQRLVSFILRKAGAEVTIAENGKIAVAKAIAGIRRRRADDPHRPFDVVLMDMQMPVMDGYEATRTLRRDGFRGPIIALTAHAMSGDREKCLEAGCDDYVPKPIDRNKLIQTIRSCLECPASVS